MRRWYLVPAVLLPVCLTLAVVVLADWPWEEASAGPLFAVWNWSSLGYYERALEEATSVAKLRPADRETHLILALLLQERGDGNRAEQEYRLAYPGAKERPYLLTALGQLYLARDEWGKARKYFADALAIDQDLAQATYGLAQATVATGDRRGAVQILRGLVNKHPSWPEAFLFLGDLMATEKADPGVLASLYETAVTANPTAVELRLRLAREYARLGQHGKAREQYARILALEPDNSEAKAAIARS